MRKIVKFSLLWFLISWPFILIITLKPVGLKNTLKNLISPFLKQKIYSQDLVLCDFSKDEDLFKFSFPGAFMEFRGGKAYVVFYAFEKSKQIYPRLTAENYDTGVLGVKDWSYFRYLQFTCKNQLDKPSVLYLKIKDLAGRYISRPITFTSKEEKQIKIDISDLQDKLDITSIISLSLFCISPHQDLKFVLGPLLLKKDPHRERIIERPFIELVEVNCSKEVKRGENLLLSLSFKSKKKLDSDYPVFLHIFYHKEKNKPSSRKKYFINADQEPPVPTSKWKSQDIYEVGPIEIYIPPEFVAGEYLVESGLFNPSTHGAYCRNCSNVGAYNYKTSFVRFNYTDPKLKDFIVARFKVR